MHAACDLRPRRSPYLVAWQTVLCSLYSLYWPSKAVASFSIRARSHRLLRSCDLAVAIARLRFFLRSLGSDFCFRLFFRCPSEFWPGTHLPLHVSRIMGPRELPTPHNAGSAQQGRDPRSGPQILLDWSSLISVSSIEFSTSFGPKTIVQDRKSVV